ncbi:MAG TPA: hypothetical protein PL041_05850 [Melioribacteraceae bacterium]|nr:hypothetical protein [Melioribacteraceae bacterium]
MKTNKDHFEKIDKFVNKRSFDTAATFLVAAKDLSYGEKDRVLYWLDLGLLYHYQGDFNNSNLMFENAEFAIDDLYTKSISKGAGSLLLNDNALDYSGEDYEDIYLNVFKCLNYLGLKKIDEAFVEIRRINEKLTLLEDKYAKITEEYNSNKDNKAEIKPGTSQFHNSALGRYLSYLLYRNENDIDGARIDKGKIDEAFSLQPELYNFSNPITDSIFLVPDTLVAINFISLFGKGPEKFAYDLVVHTDKDIIIIYSSDGQDKKQLDAINWPGVDKGLHFKLSLPRMEKKHSNVNRITIELDGKEVSEFKIIESIENVALETYKIKEPIIYLKSIARTVIKAIINEATNKELDKQTGGGLMGSLTRAMTGALLDATENADLRLARYFPSTVSINEVLVKPGNYSIKVKYYDINNHLLFVDDFGNKEIIKNNLNLFRTFYLN